MSPSAKPPAPFERSARRDWRVWLSLIAGAAMATIVTLASRQDACTVSGSCSQVVTAIATLIGLLFFAFGAVALWRNGRRGSRFDPVTGRLEWWQHRRRDDPGLSGSIDPIEIARIVIVKNDDSGDDVHLIDQSGMARAHFGSEVIPWPYEPWAQQLAQAWPHIAVEVRE